MTGFAHPVLGLLDLTGPLADLIHKIFNPQLMDGFQQEMFSTQDTGGVYGRVFDFMRIVCMPLLGFAVIARGIKVLSDSRSNTIALAECLMRGAAGLVILQVAYGVMAYVIGAATVTASGIMNGLLHLASPGQSASMVLNHLTAGIGTAGFADLLLLIPIAIFAIYNAALMIIRYVIVGYVIATAPFAIAGGVYEMKGKLYQSWLSALFGVILIPFVMATTIGVTFAFSTAVAAQGSGHAILADVINIGGLWMSAKLIHRCMDLFSHGSALGLVRTGMEAAFFVPKLVGNVAGGFSAMRGGRAAAGGAVAAGAAGASGFGGGSAGGGMPSSRDVAPMRWDRTDTAAMASDRRSAGAQLGGAAAATPDGMQDYLLATESGDAYNSVIRERLESDWSPIYDTLKEQAGVAPDVPPAEAYQQVSATTSFQDFVSDLTLRGDGQPDPVGRHVASLSRDGLKSWLSPADVTELSNRYSSNSFAAHGTPDPFIPPTGRDGKEV